MTSEELIVEELRLIEENFGGAKGKILALKQIEGYNYEPDLQEKFDKLASDYHDFLMEAQERLLKHILEVIHANN